MSLGTGIYLVAGTKENDPYIKSKKGVGIFLIILGTILFMIGALYEETYDPTNPAFLQAQEPLGNALENNTQGTGPVNQVVNTSGPVTVVAPNGSTQVGTPTNAAAAAANAGQPAVQSAVVGPAAVPRRKVLGLF